MITDLFGIISTIIFYGISCFFLFFTSSPALLPTDSYMVNMFRFTQTPTNFFQILPLGLGQRSIHPGRMCICFCQETQDAITLGPLLVHFSS